MTIQSIKDLNRIFVFDDSEDSRDDCSELISEIGPQGVPVVVPEKTVYSLVHKVGINEGLFCDYHLQKHQYAPFNGDQIVEQAYKAYKPAILCTSFTDFDDSLSRKVRRYIPSILFPSDLNDVGRIIDGYNLCICELRGDYKSHRKPWRTLVRVSEVDAERQCSYVIVPAWDPVSKIKIPWSDFPVEMQQSATKEDYRFHAKVNVGNEKVELLYFDEFEAS